MKYKYVVGLLVALSFNSGFAMDAVIGPDRYQEIYSAFHRGGAANINAALKNNEGFNHNNDVDTIRRSAAGLALRIAVISLNAPGLQTVVEANHEFFKTSLGISLVYGWALNHFKDAITPYYIGHYFSFDKMFQGLADRVDGDNVKTFLKSTFTRGLRAVEDDRWAFYDHMLYLPYAMEKVKLASPVGADAPLVDMVIANARRSRAEAANLARATGRAAHLFGNLGDADANWGADDFVGLQKYTIQVPKLCENLDPTALAIFQSLPADTDIDAFGFMDHSVSEHIKAFRAAIEEASEPVDAPLNLVPAFSMPAALTPADEQDHLERVFSLVGDVTADKIRRLKILLGASGIVSYDLELNDWANAFKTNASIDPAQELQVEDDRKTQEFVFTTIVNSARAEYIRKAEAKRAEEEEKRAREEAVARKVASIKEGLTAIRTVKVRFLTPDRYNVLCNNAVVVSQGLVEFRLLSIAQGGYLAREQILEKLSKCVLGEIWGQEDVPAIGKNNAGRPARVAAKQAAEGRNAIKAERRKAMHDLLSFLKEINLDA